MSGCGKSTLSKLISGLYKPWSGEILFDGKPISEIDRSVFTSSISVVDQDITLFEDTIENNIKLWDESIEDFEMIMAARDAQIHVFFKLLGTYEGNQIFLGNFADISSASVAPSLLLDNSHQKVYVIERDTYDLLYANSAAIADKSDVPKHDSLFYKYSKAPTTTLIVKDRVLGHNPVAALYQADGYYKEKLSADENTMISQK